MPHFTSKKHFVKYIQYQQQLRQRHYEIVKFGAGNSHMTEKQDIHFTNPFEDSSPDEINFSMSDGIPHNLSKEQYENFFKQITQHVIEIVRQNELFRNKDRNTKKRILKHIFKAKYITLTQLEHQLQTKYFQEPNTF